MNKEEILVNLKQIKNSLEELETQRDSIQILCIKSELELSLDYILRDYKRVLKENEILKKKIDLMENYMVENGWEICFDNIYAELNNCNGMERDWCRGDKLEKQDIHKYFSKKLLESEE